MAVTNLEALKTGDLTTTYDVSGGSKLFKVPVKHAITYSLQVIWENLNNDSSSIQLQGSNNDIEFDDLSAPSSKDLGSGSDSHSFQDLRFDHAHFGVNFNAGTLTSGTLLLLFKPRI